MCPVITPRKNNYPGGSPVYGLSALELIRRASLGGKEGEESLAQYSCANPDPARNYINKFELDGTQKMSCLLDIHCIIFQVSIGVIRG